MMQTIGVQWEKQTKQMLHKNKTNWTKLKYADQWFCDARPHSFNALLKALKVKGLLLQNISSLIICNIVHNIE